MAFLGWSFLSWDTLDGYLVPKKRERYQFLMDVWSNNHFPSKDLESKWTNHLYRVVSGSGSSLIVKKILFGPKAQVASHDFCSHPIAIGPWTKAVLSRKLRWSWNQISGGIGRFETVNHEATVTNISQVHLKKHISKKNMHNRQSKLCNFKIWFWENEKGRNLTPVSPDRLGQTQTFLKSAMYHPIGLWCTKDEKTEDIPVSWNPFLVSHRHVMS